MIKEVWISGVGEEERRGAEARRSLRRRDKVVEAEMLGTFGSSSFSVVRKRSSPLIGAAHSFPHRLPSSL